MLTLPLRTTPPLIVFDDNADSRPAVALLRPQIARRADGHPRVRLLRVVAPGGAEQRARLDLDLTVAPDAAALVAAGLSAANVQPIPWREARIRLEGPQMEPVEADVSVFAGGLGAVGVDLTTQQAGVLAALLTRSSVSPMQVTWTGRALVQLPAVDVIASAAIDEVRRRIDSVRGDVRRTVIRSVIDANAHIEIRGGLNAELERTLRDWALDELLDRFTSGEGLNVRVSASDVVSWPVTLAGTLDPVAAEHAERIVETHQLEASEIGATPPIDVRALGDFSGTLERVDVQLEPIGAGHPAEAALADDLPRRFALGSRNFRWRRRIKLDGAPAAEWSAWTAVQNQTALLVAVPSFGKLRLEAVSSGLDFERRWAAVRVEIEHLGSRRTVNTLELNAEQRAAQWTLELRAPRGRLSARLTFLARNGAVYQERLDDVVGEQILAFDPYAGHRRRVTLVPAGAGWDELAAAMVDLRYDDGERLHEQTIALDGAQDFAEWDAPSRPDGPTAIEWRAHLSFADGRFESHPWARTEAGVLPIVVPASKRRQVQLLPVFLDAAVTPELTVRLARGDTERVEQFRDKTPRTVFLPLGVYRWSAVWRFADGAERTSDALESDDEVLVLPKAPS
ncbi:MAG: hypothetical protein AB7U75_22445 [Hyphomicrobiaceae bacterium]